MVCGKEPLALDLRFMFVRQYDTLLRHYLSSSRDLLSHCSPTVLPVLTGAWECRKSHRFCNVSMSLILISCSIPQTVLSPHGETERRNFACSTFPERAHFHPPTAPHVSLQTREAAAIAQRWNKGNAIFFHF